MESTVKQEKFRILTEKRVTRAIRDIRLIGNLANKNNYSYTEKDGAKICVALEAELKLLKMKFLGTSKEPPVFKL